MAAEAAIMIQQKKGVLRQLVVSDIDIRIKEENDRMRLELKPMLEAIAKKAAQDTLKSMNMGGKPTREPSPEPAPKTSLSSSIHAKKAAEIKNELSRMASSGVVSMIKSQFKIGSELPIPFSAPPATMSPTTNEKKDDDEDEGSDKSVVPDSIIIDVSGSNVTEPKTIVHI
jgi:hypothetical protein